MDRRGGGGGPTPHNNNNPNQNNRGYQSSQHQTPAAAQFAIKPAFQKKVPVSALKEVMKKVLEKELSNASYQSEQATMLTKKIADDIRSRLKGLDYPRYKYMVQVVLGEQRGEGVRCGCRCFWDTDVDRHASETFTNENIFCMATVYAVYLY